MFVTDVSFARQFLGIRGLFFSALVLKVDKLSRDVRVRYVLFCFDFRHFMVRNLDQVLLKLSKIPIPLTKTS